MLLAIALLTAIPEKNFAQPLQIDSLEQFVSRCFSVMACHNEYYQGRRGAVELVMHGDRVASNGDIRLSPIPIPDAHTVLMPEFVKRTVDRSRNEITILMTYPALHFDYSVRLRAEGQNLRIVAEIQQDIPDSLFGKLAFMMEFFPGIYKGKSYLMDDQHGIFPYQFNGLRNLDARRTLYALPLASGKTLSLAPDDPHHNLCIQAVDGTLDLLDGRASTNHKWFIVRTLIPASKRVEWLIKPTTDPKWKDEPNVGFSQIGYAQNQRKTAVIESDAMSKPSTVMLYRLAADGSRRLVKKEKPVDWGQYYRKKYYHFDFSEVTTEGIYQIEYEGKINEPFAISKTLFSADFWRPTLETFIPVQMCHVAVWDRMRLWHGYCHSDDARQAPPGLVHFDHYEQDSVTYTRYAPLEHIPGMNVGGWHDAGDNDLESPSNSSAVYNLSLAYETFGLNSDQTEVNYTKNLVRLHTPDGHPDLLQQIEHGVRYILANYSALGHYSRGVICPEFQQYLQMGDAASQNDGLIFDPQLAENEKTATHSGKNDDRMVFTNKNPRYEFDALNALAIASRALRGYDDSLANECLTTALRIWNNEKETPIRLDNPNPYINMYMSWTKRLSAIELYLCTGSEEFKQVILTSLDPLSPQSSRRRNRGASPDLLWSLSRVVPELNDTAFDRKYREALANYKTAIDAQLAESPYRAPELHTLFGTGFRFMDMAVMHYFLHKAHPEVFSADFVFDIVAYMHGNHPVCNHSLANGIGSKSITSAYGANRADFSYIPGGICAGPLRIEPDFIEFQVEDPFFWVQKEYTIASGTLYVLMMLAAEDLAND